MYEPEERTYIYVNVMPTCYCAFNNEDHDAPAPGLSAPGYRSLFMWDCMAVIMMYVNYVA